VFYVGEDEVLVGEKRMKIEKKKKKDLKKKTFFQCSVQKLNVENY